MVTGPPAATLPGTCLPSHSSSEPAGGVTFAVARPLSAPAQLLGGCVCRFAFFLAGVEQSVVLARGSEVLGCFALFYCLLRGARGLCLQRRRGWRRPAGRPLSLGFRRSVWHPSLQAGRSAWVLRLGLLHRLPQARPRGGLLGEQGLGGCVVGRRGVVSASARRTDGDSAEAAFSFQAASAESVLMRVQATQRY